MKQRIVTGLLLTAFGYPAFHAAGKRLDRHAWGIVLLNGLVGVAVSISLFHFGIRLKIQSRCALSLMQPTRIQLSMTVERGYVGNVVPTAAGGVDIGGSGLRTELGSVPSGHGSTLNPSLARRRMFSFSSGRTAFRLAARALSSPESLSSSSSGRGFSRASE